MKANRLLADRSLWIGCAMIWIVWYHLGSGIMPYPLSILGEAGYGGVDICIFASGIGCFYSLARTEDNLDFFKRRFVRIMPTYFCFMLFWLSFKMCTYPLKLPDFLGNLLGIQAFTERGAYFNWYISLIILLYGLSPLFFRLVKAVKKPEGHLLVVLALLLLSVAFWDTMALIIIFAKFPMFYIGMLFAKFASADGSLSRRMNAWLIAAALIGAACLALAFVFCKPYLWPRGLHWYPFILITPGLCLVISAVAMLLRKCVAGRVIIKGLEKIADYSFELYLTHIFVIDAAAYFAFRFGLPLDTIAMRGSVLAISIAATVALRYFTRFAVKCVTGLVRRAVPAT